MLKKMSIRKIMVASFTLVVLLLLYLIPSNEAVVELKDTKIEYMTSNTLETIYLLDSNNYVARTSITTSNKSDEEKVKDLIEGLIVDGKKNDVIPNGFRSIIPPDTSILDITLSEGILTINFSKELLNIKEEYEEKMLEAIIYTLTSIKGIDKVEILVEGEKLTKLPNSGKILPTYLDKTFGINKSYELITMSNIDNYTVYYVNEYNDYTYYVPVTKYINNEEQDKIKVIVEQLSSSPIYESNLMSYLNVNAKLLDYELQEEQIKLYFNDLILSDITSNNILEEVIYTISLSVIDLYDVESVVFYANDEEIYTFLDKTLEK